MARNIFLTGCPRLTQHNGNITNGTTFRHLIKPQAIKCYFRVNYFPLSIVNGGQMWENSISDKG